MARSREPESSNLVDVPFSAEEIAAIAAEFKSFSRDKSRIDNFVRRSYATARALADMKTSFETELARKIRQGPVGTPSNMSPEQAAKFLSPQQLNRLFDRFMQDKLGVVESMRLTAESDARQIDAVVQTLRNTVASLMQDPGVPEATRQKFAQALDEAVEAASHVPVRNRSNQQGLAG